MVFQVNKLFFLIICCFLFQNGTYFKNPPRITYLSNGTEKLWSLKKLQDKFKLDKI